MDAEQAAQQIQALTASLEKVTCKNEEEHWRTEGNHNEEGSNS